MASNKAPSGRETLRALTVRQPWAWAIAHGGKNVENRTWNTTHRGTVAIHAGARWDTEAAAKRVYDLTGAYLVKAATAAVVAVADLVDVCTVQGFGACQCGPWAVPGQHHWRLANVRPVEPVPCKGRLGLWTLPADVDAAVRAQLDTAAVTHARELNAAEQPGTGASR